VLGPESEPHGLHAFLASQVIEQLDPAQREFLVTTSLLPEVTAAEATALGQKGAAGLLAELRAIHLPVAWDDGGKRMRCHPRFREFLLTLLERRTDVGMVSMAGDATFAGDAPVQIRLVEFGQPVIEVDGVVVRPRIKKSYELLAYLASRPTPQVERDELLHVLFGGRADESTRSYLRQATHRLREVLPDAAVLAFEGSRLGLHGDFRLVSDSGLVTELLAAAAQQRGRERLARLLEALSLIDGGDYLVGARSVWVDERREELRRLADDIRHETAELLLSEGDTAGAKRLALIVVRSDPYREATWRLLMNLASVSGDEAGVVNAYRMCERAMGEVGIAVSEKTELLLASLRR
jgi:DNA-binding SARP family transcriptional activator